MQLLSFETKVELTEEIRVPSLSQRVHRAITGGAPTKEEKTAEPGVHIRMTKRKVVIDWDTSQCTITLEHITSPENCIETTLSLLSNIDAVAPINQLNSRTIITCWLLPTPNYDFPSLERRYRETMIVRQPIQKGTFDSSVILDIRANRWILHHQSGAMGIKQLSDDFLLFKPKGVPKVFLFLLASITEEKVVQYSSKEMRDFLAKSFKLCKSHSNAFEQIWEGVL